MIIIGERINASRKSVKEALEKKDKAFIQKEAKSQIEAGSVYLDINCGLSGAAEAPVMEWLVETVLEAAGAKLCLDSPDAYVIEKGLERWKERNGDKAIINSITAEEDRYRRILPLACRYNCGVIALTMDETGMPDDADGRFRAAEKIYKVLKKEGITDDNIYFDPLVRPISSEPRQAEELLKSIPRIKTLGGVKIICGISNVSYGLPHRRLINSVFLSLALGAGLDGALIDPLDKGVIAAIRATEALLGKDRYCKNFIQGYRKGLF